MVVCFKALAISEASFAYNFIDAKLNSDPVSYFKSVVPSSFYKLNYTSSTVSAFHKNSICWKKGCFIGQEVTARMKNKGILKKKLYVIKSSKQNLSSPKVLNYKNELIGETTSHFKNIALALIHLNKIKKIKKNKNILFI